MTDDEWETINGIWYHCAVCFGTWSINEVFDANEANGDYFCPRCGFKLDKVEKGDYLL